MNELSWPFGQVWNASIARPEREMKPRDYMWASEMGGSLIDRYLKMAGEKPTNPPNIRSQRKFQAGHEWERTVKTILAFSGIYKGREKHVAYQYPDLLKVTGRADFIAGGIPNWTNARQQIKQYAMLFDEEENEGKDDQDFYMRFVTNCEKAIGNKELKTIVLEIKSCSSYMFDVYERTGKPSPHHALQLFHYLKSMDMREGHIVYISKDDCRILEFGIFYPSTVEEMYMADIKTMTEKYRLGVLPDKEPEVIFDLDRFKFQKNWKVEYSNYLTKLYGYSEPESFREMWEKRTASFNRVFGRIVRGDKITEKNISIIEEMEGYFPEVRKSIPAAKESGLFDKAEKEEV